MAFIQNQTQLQVKVYLVVIMRMNLKLNSTIHFLHVAKILIFFKITILSQNINSFI